MSDSTRLSWNRKGGKRRGQNHAPRRAFNGTTPPPVQPVKIYFRAKDGQVKGK